MEDVFIARHRGVEELKTTVESCFCSKADRGGARQEAGKGGRKQASNGST